MTLLRQLISYVFTLIFGHYVWSMDILSHVYLKIALICNAIVGIINLFETGLVDYQPLEFYFQCHQYYDNPENGGDLE